MTATTQDGTPHGKTNFFVYFALPVPLALFGMSVGSGHATDRPRDIAAALLISLLAVPIGYFVMCVHSTLFAVVMHWLERCRVWQSARYVVATLAGALAGYLAPLPFLLELPRLLFVLIGAWTGLASNVCVHLLARRATPRRWRQVAVALIAAFAVAGGGGITAQLASNAWITHLRDQVHAEIRPGMSSAEVERLAGTPLIGSSQEEPGAQGNTSMVWIYDEYDPGPGRYLRVWVRFRGDKVVDVQRMPRHD